MGQEDGNRFIEEMKSLIEGLNAYEKYREPVKKRRPYEDVMAVIKFREETSVTQEQVAGVLGMSKQAWSKKEKTCRKWMAEGEPEQESYPNDYRLTATQMFRISMLTGGECRKENILGENYWDWMVRLLKDAVRKDPVLTKHMLQCVAEGEMPVLKRIDQAIVPMMQSTLAEHFTEDELLRKMRFFLVWGIDCAMAAFADSDADLGLLQESARQDAVFEIKRKAYQQEFEKGLSVSCSREAVQKNIRLRQKVAVLADARPMPQMGEEQVKSITQACFEELIYRKIEFELRRSIHRFVAQFDQESPDALSEKVEKNLFTGVNY